MIDFDSGDFGKSSDFFRDFLRIRYHWDGIFWWDEISWDFYPADRGFFEIWGFLSPGIGDFYPLNFLGMGIFGDGDFFRGMGYPTKKATSDPNILYL